MRSRFDHIFNRGRTGYAMLDRLLKRLFRKKDDLLRALDRPEIPLNTNTSENEIRAFDTKRKISGGTVSDKGRAVRDVMLGLAKACMKLILSFYDYIDAELGIPGPKIPDLANLVRAAPASSRARSARKSAPVTPFARKPQISLAFVPQESNGRTCSRALRRLQDRPADDDDR